jgi:hypothetical protein
MFSCIIKLTKYFYLITVIVVEIYTRGQVLDNKIVRYDSPNYEDYP